MKISVDVFDVQSPGAGWVQEVIARGRGSGVREGGSSVDREDTTKDFCNACSDLLSVVIE